MLRRIFTKGFWTEPSTLRGIVVLLGMLGVSISPELQTAIIQLIVALIAVIELLRRETPSE